MAETRMADPNGGEWRARMAGDPNGGDPNGGDPNGGDPNGGDPNGGDPNGPTRMAHSDLYLFKRLYLYCFSIGTIIYVELTFGSLFMG